MNVVDLLLRKVLKVWTEKEKKSNYELLICDLSMKSQILYEKYPPPAKWLTLQTSNFYKRLPYSVKISILQTNKRA